MGTVSEKLSRLQETKEAVKAAITDMGGTVPENEPFSGYPALIRSIPPVSQLPSGVLTITVENPTPDAGSVTPGGYVSKGMRVNLVATPKTGYEFSGWAKYVGNNKTPTIITKKDYTFAVSGNMRFVAQFDPVE